MSSEKRGYTRKRPRQATFCRMRRHIRSLLCCLQVRMKVSHAHAALAAVMATCAASTALAFLPPPTAALARGTSLAAAAARNGHGALGSDLRGGAPVAVARVASRLGAAREDCKSCVEAELLEEERKRAGAEGEDGGKRVAARRAALEEVRGLSTF